MIDPVVCHEGWARTGKIKTEREFLGFKTVLNHYETNDSPVGPLFWAHYSYLVPGIGYEKSAGSIC